MIGSTPASESTAVSEPGPASEPAAVTEPTAQAIAAVDVRAPADRTPKKPRAPRGTGAVGDGRGRCGFSRVRSQPSNSADRQPALAAEVQASAAQINAAVALLDEGATVPFIARYRKEVTGGLDDTQLRLLDDLVARIAVNSKSAAPPWSGTSPSRAS